MSARPAVVLAALISLAASNPVSANDPTAFACTFTAGVTHSYEKGKFVAEASTPLLFGIANIDATNQSAELRTLRGTGLLRLVQAVNAMHFLEVVTEGFLHITTIYDKDEANGTYPAVHSRHFGVLGQPLITQYQGTCLAKE